MYTKTLQIDTWKFLKYFFSLKKKKRVTKKRALWDIYHSVTSEHSSRVHWYLGYSDALKGPDFYNEQNYNNYLRCSMSITHFLWDYIFFFFFPSLFYLLPSLNTGLMREGQLTMERTSRSLIVTAPQMISCAFISLRDF